MTYWLNSKVYKTIRNIAYSLLLVYSTGAGWYAFNPLKWPQIHEKRVQNEIEVVNTIQDLEKKAELFDNKPELSISDKVRLTSELGIPVDENENILFDLSRDFDKRKILIRKADFKIAGEISVDKAREYLKTTNTIFNGDRSK